MKPLLILFFSLSTLIAAAQDTQIHPNTPGTSKNAAPHEAMFPGGFDAWRNFIAKNIKTKTAKKNHAPPGNYTVTVSFLIDKSGKVTNIKVLQDPGYGTAEDVLRVLQKAPLWIPAFQNGHNVMEMQKQSVTYQVTHK